MSRYSESYQYDISKTYPFVEIPEHLPMEQWKPIEDRAAKDILPYYMISNYGRIFHRFRGSFMSTSWDGPGYRIAVLRTRNGARTFRVHRLMMLTFKYFDGCENLVVDHVNGNKSQNWLGVPVQDPITGSIYLYDNLRWLTQSENTIAAIELGIKPMSSTRYLTEDQVHEICRLLQENNLSTLQIGEICGTNKGVVENIRYGRSWKHVSKQYTFQTKKYFTDDFVRTICNDLQNGRSVKDIAIARNVNMDFIKGIKYRRTHTDISKGYKF